MSDCDCEVELKDGDQKTVLYWLLGINAVMFVLELGVGWFAQSTGLIADSLDMLADAIVYGIALYAVGRAITDKARAALISGYFQLLLAIFILIDIIRRIAFGSDPASHLMMGMGLVALAANVTCLLLIQKHRHGEVHMRASWIFSTNDVLANLGVIISGALVAWVGSRWPDIVIGSLIVILILRGAWLILSDAKRELKEHSTPKPSCCDKPCGSSQNSENH
ncbi:cation transporter [Cellvibrio sp. QJXJ]|uniref:cation transporter n=1 Tax=Cellvibrio sp. QJXJ TaxID=2964606 RepID=UPI0021C4996B|nr:cation transporter [Cellvibrio sp. QJXJ]UUA74948.1 cation transporter [Cellvibrio sp. QJXJ]